MAIKPHKILKNCRPLCFVDANRLLMAQGAALFYLDIHTYEQTFVTKAASLKQSLGAHSKLLTRLLRLGFHTAALFKNKVFLAFDKSIFTLDINTHQMSFDSVLVRGSRPLNFSVIENIEGFDDGIYYGEYFSNHTKTPAHIFKKQDNEWIKVFTFEANEIEHIHNIIPDPARNAVWILTGDFKQGAAIWLAKNNFTEVVPISRGTQQSRSCIAFPSPTGLIYGTDSQFEQNYIRHLQFDADTNRWQNMPIVAVNGSVIYGCEVQGKFVFSTAVEPAATDNNFFDKYLSNQRGIGIIHNRSEIVVLDTEQQPQVIRQNDKDIYPFGLFQFGTITFPSGYNASNQIFAFNIALKQNDLSTEIYHL